MSRYSTPLPGLKKIDKTTFAPDLECKCCAQIEPIRCPWARYVIDGKNKVAIHEENGEELIFRVLCFSGYGS